MRSLLESDSAFLMISSFRILRRTVLCVRPTDDFLRACAAKVNPKAIYFEGLSFRLWLRANEGRARLPGMRGMFGSIGRLGSMVPAALALLLLFRLLIPAGYMIAPDREGRPGLELCAPGVKPAAQPQGHGGHDGHPAEQAPSGSGERPCVFAALGAPPLPPAPPALPPQAPDAAVPPDLPAAPALPRMAAAAPPPPARGPPPSV